MAEKYPKIFINYRRKDARGLVEKLYESLVLLYGEEEVFFDKSRIVKGEILNDTIKQNLKHCDLFLPVIGPNWDRRSNLKRLEEPMDWVRQEMELAIKYDKQIIPILIDRALIPNNEQIPHKIKHEIFERNAIILNENTDYWDDELRRYADEISTITGLLPIKEKAGSNKTESGQDNFSATRQIKKTTILLPDIDWVEIPEGKFIYQDKKRKINLDRFFISRYPITNSQYQAFIDAGGYDDERWWQGLIKPEPEKPRWSQSNRPRDTVDWYESVAFTRWLSKQLGLDIILPTEQQWEKAARGKDGREYPWGKSFHSGDANVADGSTTEQSLQETTAVGLYPHRVSPYGLMDMAGNLWEWCLNKYDSPEDIGIDTSENSRVVRGGSWINNPGVARCAFRLRDDPDYRNNNRGFRVVCSSPFTGL